MSNETYTRAELLALAPQQYLAGGYYDGPAAATPRPELNGTWALASAERLNQEHGPDHLLDQALAELRTARDRLEAAGALQHGAGLAPHLPELRAVAARPAYRPHPVLADLLQRCLEAIKTPRDLDACLGHLDKINALAALTATLREVNARIEQEQAGPAPE